MHTTLVETHETSPRRREEEHEKSVPIWCTAQRHPTCRNSVPLLTICFLAPCPRIEDAECI
jgi:hypothetical protein